MENSDVEKKYKEIINLIKMRFFLENNKNNPKTANQICKALGYNKNPNLAYKLIHEKLIPRHLITVADYGSNKYNPVPRFILNGRELSKAIMEYEVYMAVYYDIRSQVTFMTELYDKETLNKIFKKYDIG